MDRADVIILGGGLVGLALAAALDASGLSASSSILPIPDSGRDAKFDGRTSAVSSSSKRMFDTIGISEHFPEPGCPIRRIEVADGLEPGGLRFRSGRRRRAAGLDAREPPSARGAARAGRGRQEYLAAWKSRAASVERGEHGVMVRSTTARVSARRCWSPPRGATRRCARRPASASPAGNMTMRRSSRRFGTSGRTTMSPRRSSIRRPICAAADDR